MLEERPGITTDIPQLTDLKEWLIRLFKGRNLKKAEAIFELVVLELKNQGDALSLQARTNKKLPPRKGKREILIEEEINSQITIIRAKLLRSLGWVEGFYIEITEE